MLDTQGCSIGRLALASIELGLLLVYTATCTHVASMQPACTVYTIASTFKYPHPLVPRPHAWQQSHSRTCTGLGRN